MSGETYDAQGNNTDVNYENPHASPDTTFRHSGFLPEDWECIKQVSIRRLMADEACPAAIIHFAYRVQSRNLNQSGEFIVTPEEIKLILGIDKSWIDWLQQKGYIKYKKTFQRGDIVRRILHSKVYTEWFIIKTARETAADPKTDSYSKGYWECYDLKRKHRGYVSDGLIKQCKKIGNINDYIHSLDNQPKIHIKL